MIELHISLPRGVPFTFTLRPHFLLPHEIPCVNYKAKHEASAFSARPAPLMATSPE